jgi:TonB family protein
VLTACAFYATLDDQPRCRHVLPARRASYLAKIIVGLSSTMRDFGFPDSSGSRLFDQNASSLPMGVARAHSTQEAGNAELIELLRRSVDDESRSTDSLLAGIAEAARQLTGAEAAALALEQNGTIICRSRSGPVGPELGAPVSTNSGISGECLRRATILISTDTLRDTRVDPDVCSSLGIRSIAVVPLLGASSAIGILEVFSGRAGAFESEQIELLRDLAEIAEGAYEREKRRLKAAETPVRPAALLAAMAPHRWRGFDVVAKALKRDYRIIAAASVAVALISLVVWTSLRKTQAEIAASEAAPQTQALSPVKVKDNSASKASTVTPVSRPTANRSSGESPDSLLHKAAELSPVPVRPSEPAGGQAAEREITVARGTKPAAKAAPPDEPPPAVELASSATPGVVIDAMTSAPSLPPFTGAVSQATEAKLMRRVDPVYPPQARIQRLEGSVVLDATIGRDGTVRSTKVVSGPVALAEAAAAAVRNWRYAPATLNGNPTETLTRITVVFKLP